MATSSVKHLLKLRSVAAFATGVVNVFAGNGPALLWSDLAPHSQVATIHVTLLWWNPNV